MRRSSCDQAINNSRPARSASPQYGITGIETGARGRTRSSALDGDALPPEAIAQMPPGATGELVFSVNPLIYCYNLPLFTALAIAVPGEEGAKWRIWSWGLPWLFAAQVWGVGFDTLKTLLFGIGPEAPALIGISAWHAELVALGYQLGFLILSSVLPIAIWFVLYRDYLASLVGDQRGT